MPPVNMLPRAVSVLLLHGFAALNVGELGKPVCIRQTSEIHVFADLNSSAQIMHGL